MRKLRDQLRKTLQNLQLCYDIKAQASQEEEVGPPEQAALL